MTLPLISPLPDAVINQIAAGEVVERPASIIKELVENSLDAGARRIDLEVEEGGVRRLLVRDDGIGIPPGQFALALRRHCTSKLRRAEDLARLISLGFRGEALAAIASVSDLTLTSRTAEEPHAWQSRTDAAGQAGAPTPAAHPIGTSIEVCELFARVPARRRFLRQAQTEWLQVLALVRRLAFCNPLVQFNLSHDGTRALMVPPVLDDASHARRLKALFGNEFASAAQAVELATPHLRVFGFVAGPALARSQSDLQLLAVNGRVIRDRQLAHAVRLAYDERLPAGRHPCYALQLDMLPEDVDVNVHPGKLEVRFRDLREVHDLLHSAVRQGLGDTPLPAAPEAAFAYQPKLPGLPPLSRAATPLARDAGAPARAAVSAPTGDGDWAALFAGRYAVLLAAEALTVVDLQAYGRRVLEVRLGLAPAGAMPTRPLLLPVRIECRDESARQSVEAALRELGLAVHPLGQRTLALRSLPRVAPEIDAARLGLALAERGSDGAVQWLAAALAAALVVPAGLAERRQWWQHWLAQAAEAGVTPEDFTLRLDPAGLAQLMAKRR